MRTGQFWPAMKKGDGCGGNNTHKGGESVDCFHLELCRHRHCCLVRFVCHRSSEKNNKSAIPQNTKVKFLNWILTRQCAALRVIHQNYPSHCGGGGGGGVADHMWSHSNQHYALENLGTQWNWFVKTSFRSGSNWEARARFEYFEMTNVQWMENTTRGGSG